MAELRPKKQETCKGCGRALITFESKCIFCDIKASFLASGRGKQMITASGAKRVRLRELEAEKAERGRLRRSAARSESPQTQVIDAPLYGWKSETTGAAREQPAARALTWQEAEILAWGWMLTSGYPDARLTPRGADGGVDVESAKAVAQVKHHAKPVGRPDVQRIYAVAVSSNRKALFFSSGGYTKDAAAWAKEHGVAL